ncbi:hypothetical protein, partial [Pleomorphochaeta sp. DL1XJH-081]|uniref:hypothetical protein n=1 Tax=Pleomorphochaeta sp. DL1XJH-081 TaxID=3409690 RepID=UPI003BB75F07
KHMGVKVSIGEEQVVIGFAGQLAPRSAVRSTGEYPALDRARAEGQEDTIAECQTNGGRIRSAQRIG